MATGGAPSEGGGIYNIGIPLLGNPGFGSQTSIVNAAFRGNTADDGGAVFNEENSPTIANSSFYDNSGTSTDVASVTASPVVSASCSQEDLSALGSGNVQIMSDPFVPADHLSIGIADTLQADGINEVYLDPASACVNAGDNAAANNPDTGFAEFDSDWRVLSSRADGMSETDVEGMGAETVDAGRHYERAPVPKTPDYVWLVDIDAAPGGDGRSWGSAFDTIGPALALAAATSAGGEVWVAEGTYRADSAEAPVVDLPHGVTLRGGFDGTEVIDSDRFPPYQRQTVLSGDFDSSGTATSGDSLHTVIAANGSRLERITVTRGYAAQPTGEDSRGAGIYHVGRGVFFVESSEITGNRSVGDGAGIYSHGGSPRITGSRITGNVATGLGSDGGGIFTGEYYAGVSDPLTISNSTISDNTCTGFGAGVHHRYSDVTLDNVVFTGNQAAGSGGGIYIFQPTIVTVTNSTFYNNLSDWNGGGIGMPDGELNVTNSTFAVNAADDFGGGIWHQGISSISSTTFYGNVADFDSDTTGEGGGAYLSHGSVSPIVSNSAFFMNRLNGSVTMGRHPEFAAGSATPLISNTCSQQDFISDFSATDSTVVLLSPFVQMNLIGEGDRLYDAPDLINEYYLNPDSPCVDRGDNTIADTVFSELGDWRDMTTRTDQLTETQVNSGTGAIVDAGRHYMAPDPTAFTIPGCLFSCPAVVTASLYVHGTDNIDDVNTSIDITYDGTSAMTITLIHPDGTRVELTSDNGTADFTGTTFDDEAGTDITAGSSPFTGSFRPEGMLSTLDGKAVDGLWQLEISGNAVIPGTLNDWSLDIVTP